MEGIEALDALPRQVGRGNQGLRRLGGDDDGETRHQRERDPASLDASPGDSKLVPSLRNRQRPFHTETRRAMRSASAGRRRTSIATSCVWKTAEGRGFQCTLSVAAESRPQNPGQVSWLGRSESDCRPAGRFTFPGSCCRVVFEATRPHSQWRDRAGFTPDFPLCPLGTQGAPMLAHFERSGFRRAAACPAGTCDPADVERR